GGGGLKHRLLPHGHCAPTRHRATVGRETRSRRSTRGGWAHEARADRRADGGRVGAEIQVQREEAGMAADRQRSAGRASAAALLAAVTACAGAPTDAAAQTFTSEHHTFRVVTVVEGLEHPWGMAFLPDGSILVTERPGRLRLVRNGALEPEPIAGVPEVWARGQGGLLDVALHPD